MTDKIEGETQGYESKSGAPAGGARRGSAGSPGDFEDKFNFVFDQSPVPMSITRPSGEVMVNQAFLDILGYTSDEMHHLGTWQSLTHPEDVAESQAWLEKLMAGDGTKARFEKRFIHKDGSTVWADLCTGLHRDAEGNPDYLITTVLEITERKLADARKAEFIAELETMRRELEENESRLRFAQSVAHVGSWIWHMQTDHLEWSDEMYAIFGIEKDQFTGNLSDVIQRAIHPDDQAAVERANQSVANGSSPQPLEYRIVRDDGSIRVVYARAGRIEYDAEGRPVRLTGIVEDITERRHVEDALRERTMDLERSNRELQRFAYVASHDLREPLRMVASYTQLLRKRYEGRLDADADDFIGFAVDGVMRMEALIDELLAYSRVDSRGNEFSDADLGPVLDGVLKGLEVAISESNAEVTYDSMPTVACDSSQIGQVFQNLVINAIKFNRDESPRVHIGVRRTEREWVFSVRDNGIGIEPEYFERIFVIFQRLLPRQEFSGSGMGLAICRRIVERHYGRIWVESIRDEGSTFYFTLLRVAPTVKHEA